LDRSKAISFFCTCAGPFKYIYILAILGQYYSLMNSIAFPGGEGSNKGVKSDLAGLDASKYINILVLLGL
jgi:hypothetical protein